MGAVNRIPISGDELNEHLSQDFLKGVPPEKFNELAESLAGLKLNELSSTKPTRVTT
jgi:hypothetical protein